MAPPNGIKQYDSSLWSFGILTFLCCFGVAGVAFLHQKDQWNRTAEQARTDMRRIPPELIGYRQTAVFATPVPGKPTSFALLNESTFVVGSAEPPMLSLFDDTGTLLRTIDLPEEPRAIVCGTPDTIFTSKIVVAHPTRIAVYSTEGKREYILWASRDPQVITSLGSQSIKDVTSDHPHFRLDIRSLLLTADYLFAADSGNRCIYRCEKNSKVDLTMGSILTDSSSWLKGGFPGFVVYAAPITMTFSPKSGLLYIANPGRHRVDVFTQDGIYQPELSWGEPSGRLEGFTACCNPIGLAALDDGRVLTVEKGISRIKIYRTDGTLDTVVAGPDVLDNSPPEMVRTPIEPGGRYFSAVPLSEGRIAVFDFEGFIRIFAPK